MTKACLFLLSHTEGLKKAPTDLTRVDQGLRFVPCQKLVNEIFSNLGQAILEVHWMSFIYRRVKGKQWLTENGFATIETIKTCRFYFVWFSTRGKKHGREGINALPPNSGGLMAIWHMSRCVNFINLLLSCLTWPQSCPDHLGYMCEGLHKILAVLNWFFFPISI